MAVHTSVRSSQRRDRRESCGPKVAGPEVVGGADLGREQRPGQGEEPGEEVHQGEGEDGGLVH